MTKKAAVQVVSGNNTPNGREQVWRVRGGEKGTGKQYGPSIIVWPWSGPSLDQADKVVAEIAKNNDLEI